MGNYSSLPLSVQHFVQHALSREFLGVSKAGASLPNGLCRE